MEDWIALVFGEWDEQQKIGRCIEDPSRQQRPETDNGPFKCYVRRMGVGVSNFPEKSVTKV